MSAPPNPDPPPPAKRKHTEEGDSVMEDVVDDVVGRAIDAINFGCLLRLILLPFRLIWRIIEAVAD